MIAWQLDRGELKLVQATDEAFVMEDGRGGYSVIDFKSPDLANEGLGYKICPSGKQDASHDAILSDLQELCGRVSSAHLTEQEARQALQQRLLPRLQYKMRLTSLSQKRCTTLNTQMREAFLPAMRLNRNMPSAVIF